MLLVRPYTNDICAHWRFVNETALTNLLLQYTKCSVTTSPDRISLVWTCRKFLEMGFTRARRYANHPSGKNMTPRVIAHHSQQNGATVKKLGPQRSSKKRETWQ